MIQLPQYTYMLCLCTALFIATHLTAAAVRWFHVCHSNGANIDYLYPGRKIMTFSFASSIILLPCLFNPTDIESWTWARDYFPLCSIFFITILLFGYFGGVKNWEKWKRPTLLLGLPVAAMVLVEVVSSVLPGVQQDDEWQRAFRIGVMAVSLLETAGCLYAVRKVVKWGQEKEDDEFFSNTDDFPSLFADRMCKSVVTILLLIWAAVLINHPLAQMALMLLMSALSVVILITVLPSQRVPASAETTDKELQLSAVAETSDKSESEESSLPMSQKAVERIKKQVRSYVEEQKKYVDPHLNLGDVADHCDYSRTYVSKVVKTELGGFYNYVNALRLRHFEEYMTVHPMATQEQACSESGFSSRQAYYNVKKRLGG